MWNKIDHYLTSFDAQTIQIIMIVGVVVGALLLKGWMSKDKY